MTEFDYKRMFSEAKGELEKLHTAKANTEEHLEQLNAKIEALTQAANAIAPFAGQVRVVSDGVSFTIDKASGITMAVRTLFDMHRGENLTAAMVRDKLEEKGWNWGDYSNPLSTIHTVLKRLEDAKTIKRLAVSSSTGLTGSTVVYCSTKPVLNSISAIAEQMLKETE
jgi:hypothetical protein